MTPNLTFNTNDVPEDDYAFKPLPAGWHRMVAVESRIKTSRNGKGRYLEFKLKPLADEHRDRTLYARLTVEHSESEKAVAIGRRQTADLCLACGKEALTQTEELHNIPFEALLTVRTHQEFGDYNDVVKFRSTGGGSTAAWVNE